MPTQVRFATSTETIDLSSSPSPVEPELTEEETQGMQGYEEGECIESSHSALYFTGYDYLRFSNEVLFQAQRLRSILSISTDCNLPEKDAIECIGIEKYLDRDLSNDLLNRRQVYRRIVLQAQMDCDKYELADIAMAGSAWARNRAQQLGHIYSAVIQ